MLLVAKIGLVGDTGIGKTTFMNYIMGNNNNYLQPTIGVDFNINIRQKFLLLDINRC